MLLRAKHLFPTISSTDWHQALVRAKWSRNMVLIRIREKLTPGKIYLLRKDGL